MSANPPVEKPPSDAQAWLKELVTASLAVGTFVCLVFFYLQLVRLPADLPTDAAQVATAREVGQARTENTRKVVDGLFAIFAAFVGYYAGRLPAERAANAAQQTAALRASEAEAARSSAAAEAEQARRGADLLRRALPALRGHPAAPDARTAQDALATEIERYLQGGPRHA
jgi:hypothetical protein